MKIICSKSNLQKSVNIVMKAVPSKTTMPILECILIDASANEIKFTSNDMELGIERKVLLPWMLRFFLKLYVSFLIMKLPSQQTINFRQSLPVKKQSSIFQGNQGMIFLIFPL